MSIFLNLHDWLTFEQTEIFLKQKLHNTPFTSTINDLVPLIDEKKISIYWNSANLNCYCSNYWIEVEGAFYLAFEKPQEFLTPQQIKDRHEGDYMSGFVELDLECMGLNACTILDTWCGNYDAILQRTYPIAGYVKDYHNSKIAMVRNNAPIYLEVANDSESDYAELVQNHVATDLIFEQLDIKDLLQGMRFKKKDIDTIIAAALGKDVTLPNKSKGEAKHRHAQPLNDNGLPPLMKIANRIWDEHYSNLPIETAQPTKTFLLAWIKENYSKLSDNQAESLYNVTRRDPPNL